MTAPELSISELDEFTLYDRHVLERMKDIPWMTKYHKSVRI